jgi:hypothetical protein
MNFGHKRIWLLALIAFGCLILSISCSDKSTNGQGPFDIFGRMIFRPFLAGPPTAEFHLYHNGSPITDAIITVRGDTIPLMDASHGFYSRNMSFRIGDTLSYVVTSEFGSAHGNVIIPDTASIIRPVALDTLHTGANFGASWHQLYTVDGYFVHLQNQNGLIGRVLENRNDTIASFSGDSLVNFGTDSIWVETLKGPFFDEAAPGGFHLPKGIVGAAGTFREVFVSFTY